MQVLRQRSAATDVVPRSPLAPRSPSQHNVAQFAASGGLRKAAPQPSPLRRTTKTPTAVKDTTTEDDATLARSLAARAMASALIQHALDLADESSSLGTLSLDAETMDGVMDGEASSPIGSALMHKKVRNQVARRAVRAIPIEKMVAPMVVAPPMLELDILSDYEEEVDDDEEDEEEEEEEEEEAGDEDEDGAEGDDVGFDACGVHELPPSSRYELQSDHEEEAGDEDEEPLEEIGIWISRLLARSGCRNPWVGEEAVAPETALTLDDAPDTALHVARLALDFVSETAPETAPVTAPAAGGPMRLRVVFEPLSAAEAAAAVEAAAAEEAAAAAVEAAALH